VEQALPLQRAESSPGATVEERPFRAALRVTEEKAFRPRGPLACASTPGGPFKPGFGLSRSARLYKGGRSRLSSSHPESATTAGVIPSGAVLQAKRGISRASSQEVYGLVRG
jgi:hypothetical protein